MTETLPIDFPGYHIQGLVGRGGMGLVYRAEQIATHRSVAIKLLTAGSIDPARLATFRREAATLAQLEHPHVVPLYDYGEHDGIPYLVVRFLNGGTVADRLTAGPIEVGTVFRWITDVAEALDAAHQRGITHRDVKPSNLLLDEAGNVYLGDFGIAATAVDLASAPHSGSAAYASPEQARGEAPDVRSDVYSLAVTAFEMVTGKKPYESETALGMMVRHMHDPVPSARALAPSLPPAVDVAIATGMAKKPQDRPSSAGAFARSLRQTAGRAASGAEPSPTVVDAKPVRRSSRGLVIGAVLLLGAVCLIGFGVLGGGLAAWFSSPTTVPTATVRQAPTLVPATPAPTQKAIPFSDDFSDPSSGFAVSQDAGGQVAYVDGSLQISVQPGVEWYSPYRGLEERDLTVAIQAAQLTGPPKSEMAVICRWADPDNFVAAALRADGMISLWKKSDGVEERWLEWTAVPGLSGTALEGHALQLTCQDSRIRFAIDGEQVASAEDPSPAPGTLALMAGLLEPGELTVAFDDLLVSPP